MTASQEVGELGTVRRLRARRWLAAGALMIAVAAAIVLGAAYAYARSQRDVVARGIHVGTIDLGGRDWFLPRAWRDLTGGQVEANLKPHVGYSRSAVERVVQELQRQIRRPTANAVIVPSFDRLRVKAGHRGVAIAVGRLRREIVKTLVSRQARRVIEVPIRHPRPRVTVAFLRRRYPLFITIDRAAFRLRAYSHLKLVRSYSIAVGQVGLQTPAGWGSSTAPASMAPTRRGRSVMRSRTAASG